MTDLKLFRVISSVEWSCTYIGYVLAESRELIKHTKKYLDHSLYDAEESDSHEWVEEVPITNIFNDKLSYDFLLASDPKNKNFEEYPLTEFREFISPEQMEKLRIQMIEKDNGQMDLNFEDSL